jgi:hypothetical protein
MNLKDKLIYNVSEETLSPGLSSSQGIKGWNPDARKAPGFKP